MCVVIVGQRLDTSNKHINPKKRVKMKSPLKMCERYKFWLSILFEKKFNTTNYYTTNLLQLWSDCVWVVKKK